MDYAEALAPLKAPVEALLKEVAQLWKTLGLPSEVATERILEINAQFEATTEPILKSERAVVEKAQGELAAAREDALAMASEVGEELRVPETMPLLDQIEELRKERVRLEPFRERRAEELRELTLRITRECQWLGVEEVQYAVPEGQTGAAGVRAAKQRLGRLEALQEGRVVEAGKARARIKSMQDELGGPLEFRVAHEGELTGSDDGVVVLERSTANERFVREVAEFEDATRREVVASGRFETHLQRLEELYSEEIKAHRAQKEQHNEDVKARRSKLRNSQEEDEGSCSEGSQASGPSGEEGPERGGQRSRSPLVWRHRRTEDGGGGRPRGPGGDGPRPRGRAPDRNQGRPGRWSQSRSPLEGPPPLPRRRRDENGGRERPPRYSRRCRGEEGGWPPERLRRGPRGGPPPEGRGGGPPDSREISAEASRWHWRAPPSGGGRQDGWHDGPREGGAWRNGGGPGRGRPPRRRSGSRPGSGPPRPQQRRRGPPPEGMLPPPPPPPGCSESRSRTRGRAERELCRAGLHEMQGEWVDKGGGTLYSVSGRTIKRDDGRKFTLHLMRGAIGWGPNGNYYTVPDVSLQDEVRWINANNGRTAWVWERPRSPSSVRSGRSGGEGGPSGEERVPTLQ